MKKTQFFVLLCLSFAQQTVYATNKSAVIASAGLDDNPHELAKSFVPEQETFALAGFYIDYHYDELFYWDVTSEKAQYFDDGRADWFNLNTDIKVASDFSIKDVVFNYSIGLNYQSNDETFVNKETGLVATYTTTPVNSEPVVTESIADRFDHKENGFHLSLGYPINKDSLVFLQYASQNRKFENYELTGLDNLDHKESAILVGVEFKPSEYGKYFINFEQQIRKYEDRNDRDREGLLLVDTQLIFNHYQVNLGYEFQLDDKTHWEFKFNYVNRTASDSHYYDAQSGGIHISTDYQLADYHFISGVLAYNTFFYDESLEQSFVYYDQDDVEQRGINLNVEYTWVLATLLDTYLAFYANLQVSDIDSPREEYIYSKNQASIGFRWALD